MQSGVLSKMDFNASYGHLRAGTYDIRNPRYDSMDLGMPAIHGKKGEQSAVKIMNENTNEDYESACRWAEHGELSEIIRL